MFEAASASVSEDDHRDDAAAAPSKKTFKAAATPSVSDDDDRDEAPAAALANKMSFEAAAMSVDDVLH